MIRKEPNHSGSNDLEDQQEALEWKVEGVKSFEDEEFDDAINHFSKSLNFSRNDPETLIYLNNARVADEKSSNLVQNILRVGVVVPSDKEIDPAEEVLRGVAQAQKEINQSILDSNSGSKQWLIQVYLAEDNDEPDEASQIAEALVNEPSILGVIGHFSSDASIAAAEKYENNLVMISPTSTSTELSGFDSYIFRTVPNDDMAARKLAQFVTNNLSDKKIGVAFHEGNSFSESFIKSFTTFLNSENQVIDVPACELSNSFSPVRCLDSVREQNIEVILLVPGTSDTFSEASLLVSRNRGEFQLLGADSMYRQDSRTEDAASAQMVVSVAWHRSSVDERSSFEIQAIELWGGEVNWRTAMAYDALKSLGQAFDDMGTRFDRSQLQRILSNPNFESQGASGNIRFSDGERVVNNNDDDINVLVQVQESGDSFDFVRIDS